VLLLLRIVNAFAASLFLVMALVSVAFLSAARDGLGRGSPSLWTSAGWAALFALLAMLSFVNLRRAPAGAGRGLAALNLLAALPLLAGLLAPDPVARILCGTSALPFALTALLLAARR
jgi:hypothetical protein